MLRHRNPPQVLELPETVHITPSRHNPWRASKEPGARFTYRQLDVMERAGIDPDTCETVRVYDKATTREMWWPDTDEPPVFAFNCPVLEIRPCGFRLVIAPAGDRKIVHESGRIKGGQPLPRGIGERNPAQPKGETR